MEHPIPIDDGEETMADSSGRPRSGAVRETGPEKRAEPEAPRAEMPEWLARELFKIFV